MILIKYSLVGIMGREILIMGLKKMNELLHILERWINNIQLTVISMN